MLALGLVGKNISHSKSQEVYEKLLGRKIEYNLFDYETAAEIPPLSKLFEVVSGLSITSPYKRHFLNQISAVIDVPIKDSINCIKCEKGKFYGTNTDYAAICEILPKLIEKYSPSQIVVLGSGAMAVITKEILSTTATIPVLTLSRKISSNFYSIDFTKSAASNFKILIINTCSRDYVFSNSINENCIFWDFNYGHKSHQINLSMKVGHYLDGIELLEQQATFALKFWNIS